MIYVPLSEGELIDKITILEIKIENIRDKEKRETCKTEYDLLEKIAQEFDGVEKVYAIQAGREVRVMVRPEDVSDEGVYKLSQDIAERIEKEMDYPGEVKVNLVRETRAIAIAH